MPSALCIVFASIEPTRTSPFSLKHPQTEPIGRFFVKKQDEYSGSARQKLALGLAVVAGILGISPPTASVGIPMSPISLFSSCFVASVAQIIAAVPSEPTMQPI